MKVADWMTTKVETIRPTDLLSEAREKMERGAFRALPVVDEQGRLLGILTDRDMREHKGFLPSTRVTAAMNEQVVTIGPDEPIDVAADILLARRVGGLPVVAEGALVGIITASDLLTALLKKLRQG